MIYDRSCDLSNIKIQKTGAMDAVSAKAAPRR